MGITNRDKDVSEQRDCIYWSSQGQAYGFGTIGATGGVGSVPVGITIYIAGPMPYAYTVQSANSMAFGTSGAPQLAFGILRPVAGQLATFVAIGISNMVVCNGASFLGFGSSAVGYVGYSGLAAAGSTLLLGQRGDILVATTIGANTASTLLTLNLVVVKTQDVLQMDGV